MKTHSHPMAESIRRRGFLAGHKDARVGRIMSDDEIKSWAAQNIYARGMQPRTVASIYLHGYSDGESVAVAEMQEETG